MPAMAGGGPENVFLVVNPQRSDSLTIANHYISLRQIPSSNVFFLEWDGAMDAIPVGEFRERFLKPIFEEIGRRHLVEQIDHIVYSSGYPFAVDFAEDFVGGSHETTGTRAALTGMTYLYQQVMARDPSYVFTLTDQKNNYYQSSLTRAFANSIGWQVNGQPSSVGGRRYMLATMLGYTNGRGNSVDEVIAYLRRAALADGSQPPGTIYLMKMEGEVRSSTRHGLFPQVAAALDQEGVKALMLDGALPSSRRDIMGVTFGRSDFDWGKVNCTILPGAICEHLTSFGGDLRSNVHQTPLSEHLRNGAAGSSGTVAEPYALLPKFPHPWIHVHYARGATLAEAFYQSVASPYQLLVVGDPLCRPWANIPTVTVEGVQAGEQVRGTITLRPQAAAAVPVNEFRLYVDGRLIERCTPGATLQLDTTKLGDGYHELRMVGVEHSEVASQGRVVLPILVDNHGGQIQVSGTPRVVPRDGRVRLDVNAPGAKSIYVFHHRLPLGRIDGPQGSVMIDTQMTGQGPVPLLVVALGMPGGKMFAQPYEIMVQDGTDSLSQR
jgi:uncharacterized protein (TIGR03790 family)